MRMVSPYWKNRRLPSTWRIRLWSLWRREFLERMRGVLHDPRVADLLANGHGLL